MTRSPFLRRILAVLCGVAVLAGCGNEADMDPGARLLTMLGKAAAGRVMGGGPQDAAAPTSDIELRRAFQEAGQPILQLDVDSTGAVAFLTPVAVNQGVTTWVSNERINLSTRDGVIQATRGLGTDLMAASVPTAAQIARGSGSHDRLHVYLDGADQTRKFTFTCTVQTVGTENITVLGLGYSTRHITETCTGKTGTATNHYWFQGGKIRKSVQFLVPGGANMTVQAIID